jgi:hypothetical protein
MTLLEQIVNDRYAEDQISHGGDPVTERAYRRGWNHASRHIEDLVRMHMGLKEIADAPAMDLRVKHTLTGGIE